MRDAAALSALLSYDWRARQILTDDELLGAGRHAPALEGECASLLRPLQRQGFVRPLHGVRPHGGRMRLWSLADALKIQIVADLRQASDLSVNACLRHLTDPDCRALDAALASWQSHSGEPGDHCARLRLRMEGLPNLPEGEALAEFAQRSVARFVHRNRFDAVERPAFLAA